MALIEFEPTTFDSSIAGYFTADALTTDVLWDFAAADLQVGTVASWASRAGSSGALSLTPVGTAPPVALSTQQYPEVDFTNHRVTADPVTTPIPSAATIYLVFNPSAIGTRQAILDFNGLFLSIEASGRPRLNGSSTVVTVNAATLAANQRIAMALTINSNVWTLTGAGVVGNGTATPGTLNRIGFGMAGSTLPFTGALYRGFACTGIHTATQINAQLSFLRNWYTTI
jgi:hypothetical protein